MSEIKATLVKLQHLKEPVHGGEDTAFVITRDTISGTARNEPTVGEQYWLNTVTYRSRGVTETLPWFHTSRIKSIYKHGSGEQDKLVLPDTFPERESINFPEMEDGDYLLATENSVYHLRLEKCSDDT